uniref:DASH complex subunit DAM1 n=1 Tax=Peronospora matthiolae TaxID=2874970 RepID=A0AAV1U1H2_9STRA
MADPLIGPFAELCGALRGLQEQVEQLERVHNAVDDFNSAFGSFQGAIALHASCLSYPKTTVSTALLTRGPKEKHVSPRTRIPNLSELHTANGVQAKHEGSPRGTTNSSSRTEADTGNKQPHTKLQKPADGVANGVKRYGKVEPHGPSNTRIKKRRKPQTTKIAPPAWTWERHVREKIPRKYQSPAELKKLENIVLYLKNRHCAISISDLVNHSGLPVIRCKEILQTLMKLDIVVRKREKSGFVYSFVTSS